VVEQAIAQAADGMQQAVPMLEQRTWWPKHRGRVKTSITEPGNACGQAKLRPLAALDRQTHKPSRDERLAEPAPLHGQPAALQAMPRRFAVVPTTSGCIPNVV
jgi:hypothetical protein